ncbi:23378_t:CDS:2, partial [Gigaspora margarita]
SIIPLDSNLSIPESYLPNIDQASIAENSNGRAKNRKSRSKGESTIHKPTKKVEELSNLLVLIEQNRKETEEA